MQRLWYFAYRTRILRRFYSLLTLMLFSLNLIAKCFHSVSISILYIEYKILVFYSRNGCKNVCSFRYHERYTNVCWIHNESIFIWEEVLFMHAVFSTRCCSTYLFLLRIHCTENLQSDQLRLNTMFRIFSMKSQSPLFLLFQLLCSFTVHIKFQLYVF